MPKFIVPVSWTTSGHFVVDADTIEDAIDAVEENRDEKYPYSAIVGKREDEIDVRYDEARPYENG